MDKTRVSMEDEGVQIMGEESKYGKDWMTLMHRIKSDTPKIEKATLLPWDLVINLRVQTTSYIDVGWDATTIIKCLELVIKDIKETL